MHAWATQKPSAGSRGIKLTEKVLPEEGFDFIVAADRDELMTGREFHILTTRLKNGCS